MKKLLALALLGSSVLFGQIQTISTSDKLLTQVVPKWNSNFSYLDAKVSYGTGAPVSSCALSTVGHFYVRTDTSAAVGNVYVCALTATSTYTWVEINSTTAVLTSGSYSNPSWLTGLAWSKISSAPAFITLSSLSATSPLSYNNSTGAFTCPSCLTSAVTSVFGRSTSSITATTGDYTAAQVTNAVDSTGSYSNPAWLTGLAWTKISSAPAITGKTVQGTGTAVPTFLGSYTASHFASIDSNGNIIDSGVSTAGGGMANPMTTQYDIIVGGTSGTPGRLAAGSNGTVLGVNGGVLGYNSIATLLGFTPIQLSSLSASGPVSYNNTTGAFTCSTCLVNTGSYADPSWLTSLAYSKLTGTPTLGAAAAKGVAGTGTNVPVLEGATATGHMVTIAADGGIQDGGAVPTGSGGSNPVIATFNTSAGTCTTTGGTGTNSCTAATGSVVITHNLGTSTPIAEVYSGSTAVNTGVTINSSNQLTLTFTGDMTGTANVTTGGIGASGTTGSGVLPTTSVTMTGNTFTSALNYASYGNFLITQTAQLTSWTSTGTPVDGQVYSFTFTCSATPASNCTITYPANFTPAPSQPVPVSGAATTIWMKYNSANSQFVPQGSSAGFGMAPTTSTPSATPPSGSVYYWYDSTTNVLTTKDSSGATHTGGGSSVSTIRTVASGTTDTILNSDCGNAVVITSTSNLTETWPQAGSTGFAAGCKVTVTNGNTQSSGEMVSHTTSTSNFTNMGGAAPYYWTPAGITETFVSDGTNWQIHTTWPKTLWVYAQNAFCDSSDGAVYTALADATSITCFNGGTSQVYLFNSGSTANSGNSPFSFPANFFNSVNSKVKIDLDMFQTGTSSINSDFRIHLNNINTAVAYTYRANNNHWTTGTNLSGSFSYILGPYAAPGSSVLVPTLAQGGSSNGASLMTGGGPQANSVATNAALPLNFSWSFASTTATNAVMLRRIAVTWLSF